MRRGNRPFPHKPSPAVPQKIRHLVKDNSNVFVGSDLFILFANRSKPLVYVGKCSFLPSIAPGRLPSILMSTKLIPDVILPHARLRVNSDSYPANGGWFMLI